MYWEIKKYSILSYLFAGMLFVGLSCSSDDSSVVIEEESSFSFEADGKLWTADNVMVQTFSEDQRDEDLYIVNITATKGIEDASDGSTIENLSLQFYVDKSKFKNPKGTYPMPPPKVMESHDAGYGFASFGSLITNNYYFTIDPENDVRRLGEVTISNFEIGDQFLLGEGYLYLSGSFQFELYGVNSDTGEFVAKKYISSGAFKVRAPKLGL